ncbi:MAG: hypothetical protein VCB43_01040 [Myxococcota bacterium]
MSTGSLCARTGHLGSAVFPSAPEQPQDAVFIDLFKHRLAVHRYRARFEITQGAKLLLGLFTEFHTGGGT